MLGTQIARIIQAKRNCLFDFDQLHLMPPPLLCLSSLTKFEYTVKNGCPLVALREHPLSKEDGFPKFHSYSREEKVDFINDIGDCDI